MPRLFVAIDLPAASKELVTPLRTGLPGARWVSPDQLHLTLRFIGDTDEAQCTSIQSALAGVTAPPFELALQNIGWFPARGNPHVLWVGLPESPQLLSLHQDIEIALLSAGVLPDERPFSPHITIARLKDMQRSHLQKFVAATPPFRSPLFTITEFRLYASTLTPTGAIHNCLQTYPLQA